MGKGGLFHQGFHCYANLDLPQNVGVQSNQQHTHKNLNQNVQ